MGSSENYHDVEAGSHLKVVSSADAGNYAKPRKPTASVGGAQAHKENQQMSNAANTPSREELMARIEASEARSDVRFIAFEKRMDESMHRIEMELAPLKNIKVSIWGAAATTIAIFIAAFAVFVAAFDSGRDTAKMAAEAKAEAASSLSEMNKIVQELKQQAPKP